jgi:C1A family cysteine protease
MVHFSLVKELPLTAALPTVVNLRKWCSEVQDQGDLGSCTANAWAGILQFNENRYPTPGKRYFDMSRLFIYYNERAIEGTITDDSGAQLRDGAKAIANYGSAPEYQWPYDTTRFAVKPPQPVYDAAFVNHIHSYYSLDAKTPDRTLRNLKTCIAAGQPFVFGFMVYDSFMDDAVAQTGVMPMPNLKTEEIQGGHAVMAVGYNDTERRFLVRNSWGPGWGLKGTNAGYFTCPYAFISDPNMASDFWTVVKEI